MRRGARQHQQQRVLNHRGHAEIQIKSIQALPQLFQGNEKQLGLHHEYLSGGGGKNTLLLDAFVTMRKFTFATEPATLGGSEILAREWNFGLEQLLHAHDSLFKHVRRVYYTGRLIFIRY